MNPPASRLALILLPALILSACQVELQHSLNEKEANEILVLLERRGIRAEKEREEGGKEPTYKISVPKSMASPAVLALQENDLPRPKNPGFEIFNKGSLIPTATEERAMFLQALSGELSRTLGSVDGVLDARVHINIPQSDDLSDKTARPEPSAAVLVKYRVSGEAGKKSAAPPLNEEQVQLLVARAVQDLKPANVSVVMTGATIAAGPEGGGPLFVDVLGVRMAQESVNAFRAILAGLVLVILGLAGFIVYSRSRDLRPAARPRTRTEA